MEKSQKRAKERRKMPSSAVSSADVVKGFLDKARDLLKGLWGLIRSFVGFVGRGIRDLWRSFLKSFAAWSDPKLEPYREHKRGEMTVDPVKAVVVEETTYTPAAPEPPKTREDLFALLREAPMSVLSSSERKAMSAILDLPVVQVAEIMTSEKKIVFVGQDDEMGPLVLDRLYKSGFMYFPVINGQRHIIGTLHTELLNSLDVKDTKPAKEVMEPRVYYIRADYTLEQALKAFLRTNSQLMLVVDHYEKLMGMLTFEQMMNFLFDDKFQDDFARDNDRLAVAKRRV